MRNPLSVSDSTPTYTYLHLPTPTYTYLHLLLMQSNVILLVLGKEKSARVPLRMSREKERMTWRGWRGWEGVERGKDIIQLDLIPRKQQCIIATRPSWFVRSSDSSRPSISPSVRRAVRPVPSLLLPRATIGDDENNTVTKWYLGGRKMRERERLPRENIPSSPSTHGFLCSAFCVPKPLP
ncbi:hypothetical protein B0T20DRAFT_412222 [Sordaria brevicollis]|uniref:Uncharacterized protein n=1 Tax=Sordaria brevicollis TaxID=83679 RepID=A0AAE0PF58_SORBR|nr:hypothetical protein B0T20DRAFT_412222 [Sordaria brevicollis]